MLKSGQVWTGIFDTLDATGALAVPTAGPVGSLYVAGVVTADAVTISGGAPYKFSVTLPALTAGQSVEMRITATIATIATANVVASDIGDTKRVSDGLTLAATGLDAITVTDPGTVATTWPGMVVQVWRRWFKKTTMTATALKTYADAGVVVDTTQTISDDGTTQTQGAAS